MFPPDVTALAAGLIEAARARQARIVTAESCTGGLVAAAICSVSGASDVFDRGLVTYSNEAKSDLLGVPVELIAAHGAVSEPVARAMAAGAATNGRLAVAITGIAGPGGGSAEKPVGTVHIATAGRGEVAHRPWRFTEPTREGVQLAAVAAALQMLRDRLN
ncbi:CinA family protein [Phenylobacterium sp.]|jgi:nicotinamide-nucleotide amidase|uniref:CinA family protein n=1 Tax=Phenylobacterium sp. TaxID=1871053 RepID=UPI0037845067